MYVLSPRTHVLTRPRVLLRRYCNTCAFLMAPHLVPPSAATRAGGLMALVFQTASLAALGVAFGILAWQPPHLNV
jgi:hypothetical protein